MDRLFVGGGIVAYHGVSDRPLLPTIHVTPAHLSEQLEFFRTRYHVVSLQSLLERIQSGKSIAGMLALTFDDAYEGVARYALPALKSLELPATIFVTGSAVTGEAFWWDVAELVRLDASDREWNELLRFADLPSLPRDCAASDVLRTRVLARFAGRFPDIAATSTLPFALRPMSIDVLRDLASESLIDFGCHTMSHPALPFLSPAAQEREIRECFAFLSEQLPRVRRIIAYPYGLYDRTTIAAAQRAGMFAGLSTEGLPPSSRQDIMSVPRIIVGDQTNLARIAPRLTFRLRPVLARRHGGEHPRLPFDDASLTHTAREGAAL